MKLCSARYQTRVILEGWRADYNDERPHLRLGWLSPSICAAERRFAALRYTEGSAQRTVAITAQEGTIDSRTQIPIG